MNVQPPIINQKSQEIQQLITLFTISIDICKERAILLSNQYPKSIIALEVTAACDSLLGNHKQAIALYQKCLQIQPDTIAFYNNLAWNYIAEQDYHISATFLNDIKQKWNHPAIYFNLAVAYEKGRVRNPQLLDEAIQKIEACRNNYPDFQQQHQRGLIHTFLLKNQQNYTKGLQQFQMDINQSVTALQHMLHIEFNFEALNLILLQIQKKINVRKQQQSRYGILIQKSTRVKIRAIQQFKRIIISCYKKQWGYQINKYVLQSVNILNDNIFSVEIDKECDIQIIERDIISICVLQLQELGYRMNQVIKTLQNKRRPVQQVNIGQIQKPQIINKKVKLQIPLIPKSNQVREQILLIPKHNQVRSQIFQLDQINKQQIPKFYQIRQNIPKLQQKQIPIYQQINNKIYPNIQSDQQIDNSLQNINFNYKQQKQKQNQFLNQPLNINNYNQKYQKQNSQLNQINKQPKIQNSQNQSSEENNPFQSFIYVPQNKHQHQLQQYNQIIKQNLKKEQQISSHQIYKQDRLQKNDFPQYQIQFFIRINESEECEKLNYKNMEQSLRIQKQNVSNPLFVLLHFKQQGSHIYNVYLNQNRIKYQLLKTPILPNLQNIKNPQQKKQYLKYYYLLSFMLRFYNYYGSANFEYKRKNIETNLDLDHFVQLITPILNQIFQDHPNFLNNKFGWIFDSIHFSIAKYVTQTQKLGKYLCTINKMLKRINSIVQNDLNSVQQLLNDILELRHIRYSQSLLSHELMNVDGSIKYHDYFIWKMNKHHRLHESKQVHNSFNEQDSWIISNIAVILISIATQQKNDDNYSLCRVFSDCFYESRTNQNMREIIFKKFYNCNHSIAKIQKLGLAFRRIVRKIIP